MPLFIEAEMDTMSSGYESDDESMSTDMLKSIREGSQYHPIINRIEARHKIRDHFKQIRAEWKGHLLSTQNMRKVLH